MVAEAQKIRQFPCKQCGASLEFKPDVATLQCTYCGFAEALPETAEQIDEYPYNDALATAKSHGFGQPKRSAKCPRCAAQTVVDPVITSARCAFCSTPMVIEDAINLDDVIQPEAALPFALEKKHAEASYVGWIKSRWFAPNTLKDHSAIEKIVGFYRPYWTFDAHTSNAYQGERGDHYYETVGSGKNRRTVRRTRWSWRSGSFRRFFDDVLIDAGRDKIDQTDYDLKGLVPFRPEIIAGWNAERYTVPLAEGWTRAKEIIRGELYSEACSRVGGDVQRNVTVHTAYSGICYKHILLPVFLASYQYHTKVYRFLVNGQTGEVSGERPYSFWKIFFFVLGILATIALIGYFASRA